MNPHPTSHPSVAAPAALCVLFAAVLTACGGGEGAATLGVESFSEDGSMAQIQAAGGNGKGRGKEFATAPAPAPISAPAP
ncbi:MAG TPA: hypothetical protein VIP10_03000, partial [Burkholderiaceae bacterium]